MTGEKYEMTKTIGDRFITIGQTQSGQLIVMGCDLKYMLR